MKKAPQVFELGLDNTSIPSMRPIELLFTGPYRNRPKQPVQLEAQSQIRAVSTSQMTRRSVSPQIQVSQISYRVLNRGDRAFPLVSTAYCTITTTAGASTIDLRWLECAVLVQILKTTNRAIDRLQKQLQNLHPNS